MKLCSSWKSFLFRHIQSWKIWNILSTIHPQKAMRSTSIFIILCDQVYYWLRIQQHVGYLVESFENSQVLFRFVFSFKIQDWLRLRMNTFWVDDHFLDLLSILTFNYLWQYSLQISFVECKYFDCCKQTTSFPACQRMLTKLSDLDFLPILFFRKISEL